MVQNDSEEKNLNVSAIIHISYYLLTLTIFCSFEQYTAESDASRDLERRVKQYLEAEKVLNQDELLKLKKELGLVNTPNEFEG